MIYCAYLKLLIVPNNCKSSFFRKFGVFYKVPAACFGCRMMKCEKTDSPVMEGAIA